VSDPVAVTRVRFRPGRPREIASGILGYVAFEFGDAFEVGGIQVRRGIEGLAYVCWPRGAGRGPGWALVLRPLHEDVRRAVERQISAALDLEVEGAA
jgi:hypothetical protein